jgi:hypothetical protein
MPIRASSGAATIGAMLACLSVLPADGVRAEGIDTEHIFAFMIGTDTGTAGEREFQSQATGRFGREGGRYRAANEELEMEFVPFRDFRIELGSSFAAHDINGVPGFDDRRQLAWQGISADFRYRFLDRETSPFGFTVAVEHQLDKLDEITGAAAWHYGTDVALAFDREIVPDKTVAALNLLYQPEWTRFATGTAEQESTVGVAFALMTRLGPNILFGGEARYFRRYEGIGLEEFAGQALFVGPTAYFQLSERARLTAAWSIQAWGRPAGSNAALDLVNFERHQARLVFGINF